MSEKTAQSYLEKLAMMEKKLLKSTSPGGEIQLERNVIKDYMQVLQNFGSYDPKTQQIILEDLDRDITRITKGYQLDQI